MSGIRFEDVSHGYGERPVLHEISLDITEQRVGIVGANGSGKSTLARMVNGLVTPDRGRVSVHGRDVAKNGREVRRLVGFVFTNPDNQIVMPTVAEDVAFSLRRRGLAKEEIAGRVAAILERFGLSGHADHAAHRLSGGQKQLLALASVLIAEPAVVVADEPTTLLDARNARLITDLLTGLDQQVLVVTHQLELLAGFDRVIVVEEGRIVADDVPDAAIRHYLGLLA
ncbi:energy-coupling factor ABC transporter ATP-binding protein [Microterricola pindariensis]|uniref:Cobalt ABC transporter ATP-binding protein n=1 Tax=Microterricola pindariensis TaxID=478010 RepID=A0ABX5AVP1_9MICO|nr:ABC transporter ATP-binding protein [Microterricola pindariensis]PPL18972.1 cobalt ABC transporter ATP-binding protein [Microterricola pindariensis]